jgi:hypothetical protein
MKRLFTLVASASLLAGTLAAAGPLDGTFALQSGAPKARAFLRTTFAGANPLNRGLDIWLTPLTGSAPILHYGVDMTKLLHLIIVSDDFKEFFHVHPVLGADGHFTIDQSFPQAGHFQAYVDSEPQGLGQQVFRFAVTVGDASAPHAPVLAATGPRVAAGPYVVTLSTIKLEAGKDNDLIVHVLRNGKPARDLHPYLGALAHAVFLDARDLTYLHVHPAALGAPAGDAMPGMPGMDMPALSDSDRSSPDMSLHVTVREAGTYKLWLEFRGGPALYVAPFVVTAS